ncbi:DUF5050 domain-containing protein [Paenibacillus eucommiae]|uniref:Prolow-density lipoprotein receptor-related protein 1-like beta-propeller domain-containing protein n=1 Tax=Paenibacillus eucommiae TaxID=1355755 RepID=A0ABS4J8U8_9BACL|nr:DUF5050 domain-containing protein [Paenibacillus eucommiae]MBP1996260.1 hypothetical protein [Paenibacillus eucommiae]
MRKWTGFMLVFSLCVSMLAPAGQIKAAAASVKVTLPNFEVKLNGHTVENQYREYPLLVYRGITYFPMTWNDTRMFGLETTWSQAAGLNIKQSPVTSSYAPYKSGSRNKSTYSTKISTSAITVNGKVINNSKEPYPLLNFRDITYFPLTWGFAHDEFGWNYKWSTASGLSITSHNPQLQTAGLPAYAANNDVVLFKGYYYFVETKGSTNHIYRASEKQSSAKEEIFSYTFDKENEWQPDEVSFQIRDNHLWFTYHRGEGVAGTDEFFKINDNGKAELLHSGYLDFRDTPYGTLIINLGSDNDYGNLFLQDGTNRKPLGEPEVNWGYPNPTATTVVGDDIYLLSRFERNPYFIYRVNLRTNNTEKIVDSAVSFFQIFDNKLYYINKDDNNALYSSMLDGTNKTKLSEHAVSWFDSIEGNIYYTNKINSTQFELYKVNLNGNDTLVWTSPVASVQVLNNQLVLQLGGNNGVVLLDNSGRLLLKVAEPISRVLTSDNGLLLQNAKNSSLAVIRL